MTASVRPRLTVRDGVKAAAAHTGALEVTLSSASSALTESEVVAVGAALVAMTGNLNIFRRELSEASGVVLESGLLVGTNSGLVEIKEHSLELAISAWRTSDTSKVIAALSRAAVAVECTLAIINAPVVFAALSISAASAGFEVTTTPAAVVFTDLAVAAIFVTFAPVRDGGAGVISTLETSLAV